MVLKSMHPSTSVHAMLHGVNHGVNHGVEHGVEHGVARGGHLAQGESDGATALVGTSLEQQEARGERGKGEESRTGTGTRTGTGSGRGRGKGRGNWPQRLASSSGGAPLRVLNRSSQRVMSCFERYTDTGLRPFNAESFITLRSTSDVGAEGTGLRIFDE